MATHEYKQNGLTFRTEAKKVDSDWYEWRVELADGHDELSRIKEVEYILHPTFPKRVRVEKDADKSFGLESAGWGEFDVVATSISRTGMRRRRSFPLNSRKNGSKGLAAEITPPSKYTPPFPTRRTSRIRE